MNDTETSETSVDSIPKKIHLLPGLARSLPNNLLAIHKATIAKMLLSQEYFGCRKSRMIADEYVGRASRNTASWVPRCV